MIKISEWREIVEKNMSDIFARYDFSFDEEGEETPPAIEVYAIYKSKKTRLKFFYDQRNLEQNVYIQLLSEQNEYGDWMYLQDLDGDDDDEEIDDDELDRLIADAARFDNLPFDDLSHLIEILEEYLPYTIEK